MSEIDFQFNEDGTVSIQQRQAGSVKVYVSGLPEPVTVTKLAQFKLTRDGKLAN